MCDYEAENHILLNDSGFTMTKDADQGQPPEDHAPPLISLNSDVTNSATNQNNLSNNNNNFQEEKFRNQQLEASRRENVLVMRLTAKEQEVQEYLMQLEELRAGFYSSNKRNNLLDPALNAIFQRTKLELQQTKEKLSQNQQEFDAWKFTPDSSTGKRLMAKCRLLIQENEELGKITSVGRIAKLEGDIGVIKKLCEDLKSSQKDIEAFLLEMDENMEGMQSTVMSMQRKIRDLQDENRFLKNQLSLLGSAERPPTPSEMEIDPQPERVIEEGRRWLEFEPEVAPSLEQTPEIDFDLISVIDRILTCVTENEQKFWQNGSREDDKIRTA